MSTRAPLAIEAVRSLSLAGLIIAGWLFIHVGGIFFFDLQSGSAFLALAVVLVQAWLSTGLFIIAHDCMHGSLAPGRQRLNTLVGTLCLSAYAGLSYAGLYPKHHQHHATPGTALDPDFHPGAPRSPLIWFVRFFRGYSTLGQLLRINVVASFYLLLGAPLLNIVVFWAFPAVLALTQLFVFGTYLPHRHNDTSFADGHNARNLRLSPLASLLTCFHFGGYHHEHHLSPGTPWWRLPRLKRHDAVRSKTAT